MRYSNRKQYHHLYNSQNWRNYRAMFLKANPLCVKCREVGALRPATVVDHVRPHKGNTDLFWSVDNHQALCKPCHDSAKAFEENRGYSSRVGNDGWPVDPRHPANNAGRTKNPDDEAPFTSI